MAGDERVGSRPPTGKASLDDLGVGATDRDSPHPAQDLVGGRLRPWDLTDLERVRSR